MVVLIVGNRMFCANIGDARAVMSRGGNAIDMSRDHKSSDVEEQERIKAEGGYIVFGRVLGRLAITRAFGDFECKNLEVKGDDGEVRIKNFVTSEPEIREIILDPLYDEFMILASDGLFDKFNS